MIWIFAGRTSSKVRFLTLLLELGMSITSSRQIFDSTVIRFASTDRNRKSEQPSINFVKVSLGSSKNIKEQKSESRFHLESSNAAKIPE